MITEMHLGSTQLHNITGNVAVGTYAISNAVGLLGTATPREDRPQKARRHGLYELTSYYDGRPISLSGRVNAASDTLLWTAVDQLKKELALNGLVHTLKWRRQGLAYLERCNVSVASPVEITVKPGFTQPIITWDVDLIAADPRIYKDTLDTVTFASSGNATNDGNFNTQPIVTFNTPGTNPGIRNNELTTENEINLVYGGGGTALVVDVAAREITLDGASRPDLINPLTNSFWSLVSGTNSLSKIGGAASITVEWRDAWN